MTAPLVTAGGCDETGVIHLDIQKSAHQSLCKDRFAGRRIEIEVRLRKSKRSFDQNAWMHAALTRWIVEALPEYREPAMRLRDGVERLKDELLALVFGWHVYQSQITGEIVKSLAKPHTSGLSTGEMTELMDVAVVEAAKTGHIIDEPAEWKARKAAAAKKGRAA